MKGKRFAIALNTLSKACESFGLGGDGLRFIKAVKIFCHPRASSIDKILNMRITS
ncbi:MULTISPECIES: hypothetical protein [unclassified Microcoleus]|uniref:hypothetical protein n=1 Tax=unclassified Microcoleus TaxID=2642155 RepID=UPI002FD0A6E7